MQDTRVPSLGREDPLEKGIAIHSSILTWRIPWKEKPGRLQFIGSQRVGHNSVTSTHMVFPVIRYGYENCTIKKAENQRIDAFEL